jgi:hypothetical protein
LQGKILPLKILPRLCGKILSRRARARVRP